MRHAGCRKTIRHETKTSNPDPALRAGCGCRHGATAAHTDHPQGGLALHEGGTERVAERHRTPRLGHLRPLRPRERHTARCRGAERRASPERQNRPHGRPAIHGQGILRTHPAHRFCQRQPRADAALRRRHEPGPRAAQRQGGRLLALRLQLILVRHHRRGAGGRQHAPRRAGEHAAVVTLVPGRGTLPQRTPHLDRQGTHPRMGHLHNHPLRIRRLRLGTSARRGGGCCPTAHRCAS